MLKNRKKFNDNLFNLRVQINFKYFFRLKNVIFDKQLKYRNRNAKTSFKI